MISHLPSTARAGLLIVACQALILIHVAVVPAWEAPDEPWHLAYAESLAAGRPPGPAETYEHHHPPGGYLWPTLALRALGWRAVPRAAYEPRFPLAANAYLHPLDDPGAAMLRLLRVWNSLLAAPALALAWAAARRLGRNRLHPSATVATALCLLIPMAPFTLATLTNDSAALLVGALLWYLTARSVDRSRAGTRRRASFGAALFSGGALGLSACLAAAVKLNVLMLVIVPVLAVTLAPFGIQRGAPRRRASWLAAAELVIAAATTVILVLALSRIPTLAGLGRLPDQLLHRSAGGGLLRSGLGEDLLRLLDSTAGVYGWMNVVLDDRLRRLVLILVAACLSLGLLPARWMIWREVRPSIPAKAAAGTETAAAGIENGPDPRPPTAVDPAAAAPPGASVTARIAALAGPLVLVAATLGNVAMDPAALQGRLLLPAWPAAAWLAASGLVRLPRVPAIAVAGLLLGAQLVATGRLLPIAYGAQVNDARLLQRGTEQPVEPSLRLSGGQTVTERLTVTAPLALRRLELGVLVGRGSGSLRLRLWRESGSLGTPILLAQNVAPLVTLGRRAIDGRTRVGPLADTHWLGVDLPSTTPLGTGDRLLVSVDMIAGTAGASNPARAGAGGDEALLWTAEPPAAALLRREPQPADDGPALAWIAYGLQTTEAPR